MKTYKNVYFRIETPCYYNKSTHSVGFNNNQDRENFRNTALNLFLNDGWEIKKEAIIAGIKYAEKI